MTKPLTSFLSCFLIDVKVYPERYFLSFFASIMWLSLIVFFIISWVEKCGCLIGVSAALMGLTLGAAGTSAPDTLVSFHVARNGLGDMAIANAFGSNIFDILLCLGLPWTIQTAILKKKVMVEYEEFKATFFILVGLYFFFILVLMISYCKNGAFVLSRKIGWMFMACYFAYVSFCIYFSLVLQKNSSSSSDDER